MGGFFGSTAKQNCINDLYYGTDYHSHLGTRRGGLAVFNSKGFQRSIHNIENDYFRSKFEGDLPRLHGNKGIGIISDYEDQPIIVNSHMGKFAIVTVGKIKNIKELEKSMLKKKRHFSEYNQDKINPTELVAMLICEETDFKDGIKNVYNRVKGSCSLLILKSDGIIAARDKLGRTPVIIGKKDGAFAAASESVAFANTGYEVEHDLGPGEIVFLTADGYQVLKTPENKMQVCSFLWVYYGYPPSDYEGINVDKVRYKCGSALGRYDDMEVDCVAGIPDSGIGHAIGYSNQRQLPYARPYVKYTPTWPRSFMPQNQNVRELVARMKLIPNKSLIEGKKIVFLDDSIVRGTQLRDNVQILKEVGAKEVHLRIACPTLIYPCEFLNFSMSRSTLDLAGRRAIKELEGKDTNDIEEYHKFGSECQINMVENIKERLGMTTLRFQKLDDLVEAIGLPKQKLCTHCWDNSSYY